jgi:hypothetical protein
MAARTFIGAVGYHSLIKELFGPLDVAGDIAGTTDTREASRLMVSIWLDGMSAAPVAKLKNSATSRKRASRQALTEILEPTT